MPVKKQTKKEVIEPVVETIIDEPVLVTPGLTVHPEYDPSLPENKQRHIR